MSIAITDDELLAAAPNILVQVGTPPPFVSSPFDLPPGIPQYIYTILDLTSRKTKTIGNDRTKDLIQLARSKTPPSEFLIKTYFYPNTTAPPSASPAPPSPPLPPITSTKTPIPDLPDTIPFPEIAYRASDILGITPPVNAGPGAKIKWTPLQKSMYNSFRNFPSAIYIDDISSCISTPYFAPQDIRHRNGVMNDARTNDRPHTTYYWQCDSVLINNQGQRVPVINPRPDGAIDVIPQSRDDDRAWPPVYLDPGKWERKVGINNGDSLNAFSLIFGINPGGGDNQSQAAAWNIKVTFGDITLQLYEGRADAEISIKGSDTPTRVMIKPSSASLLTDGFGPRPYIITFIPVWNGLLVSDGIPGSSSWANSVIFIPRDKELDINKAITDIINPPNGTSSLPPKVVVQRLGKRYKEPGVKVTDSTGGKKRLDMGTRLSVTYTHCGGSLKFVPVYFPQFSRYHFIYHGAVDPADLTRDKSTPINQNVFKIPTKSSAIVMPIFSFESSSYLDFRTNLATIITDKAKPFSCLSMEFESRNPDVRRPMQVWGAMVQDTVVFNQGGITNAPPNSDGVLSISALNIPRIRSFNINRSLDGSSGDIVWDRWNPILQQVDPRPFQEVGAIQVGITGGANTVPGVVFTGIAYGNSEDDMPGENLVRIPLRGRESKISSEGGLALINVPFFDGYDHRDAMSYMANYGGFPIDTSLAAPFRLISSYNINNPILDFPAGTAVIQAMDTISQQAGALYYFDRFGTLIYIDSERSTSVNWNYPDLILESFSDEPDSTWVRNEILIFALVAAPGVGKSLNTDFTTVPTQAVMVQVPVATYPAFSWAKMAVYGIPQIVRDINELTRLAVQIAKGQSRPRATARCRVPGNASIELLDTINSKYIVTSISQQADTQRKTWSTELGVELFIPDVVATPGPITVLPLSDFG